MRVGFTGSREQTVTGQLHELRSWLNEHAFEIEEFHHGCCVGADTFAHYEAMRLKLPIVYHPPTDMSQASDLRDFPGVWRRPKQYLDRNRAIVDESDILLAMPKGEIHDACRHGTCWTVRLAVRSGKEVKVFNNRWTS